METIKALGIIFGVGILLMWLGQGTWVCAIGGFALFIGVVGLVVEFFRWASTKEL